VLPDPRDPVAPADHAAKVAALAEMGAVERRVRDVRQRLDEVADGVEIVLETLDADETALREQGERLQTAIDALVQRHFTGPECQGMCRGDVSIGLVGAPMGRIADEDGAPSENTRIMMQQAQAAADRIVADIQDLLETQVEAYRTALLAAGYTPFGEER